MDVFQVVDPNIRWELAINDVFEKNAWRLGGVFLLYLTILCIVVFIMTHRVYGPLVSIERFVSQIEKGEYHRRARIREKDDLGRLVNKLNAMAEKLESRHGKKAKNQK